MNQLMLNNLPNILGFIAFIATTLLVFILVRELICWYFKINERVKLQKDAIHKQDVIINLLRKSLKY